jgi:hypothetical protein
MTTKAPLTRHPRSALSQPVPIRLMPDELEKTIRYAEREQRSRASFIRLIYLRGLADYEKQITPHSTDRRNAMPAATPRDFTAHPPRVMDRIAFRASDGSLRTGYVAAVRQRLDGDGYVAWLELEHDPAGRFCAIPLADVIGTDDGGEERSKSVDKELWRRLESCDFSEASPRLETLQKDN